MLFLEYKYWEKIAFNHVPIDKKKKWSAVKTAKFFTLLETETSDKFNKTKHGIQHC